MFSLGFDTLIVNCKFSDQSDLLQLFDIFYPLGIKNYIFTRNVDIVNDHITFVLDSNKDFKKYASGISPRGAKIKTACCVSYADGLSQNPYLKKLCFTRDPHCTFISLPIFPSFDDNVFATELNKLLYRSKIFPVFNAFERTVKTSSYEFYAKLLSTNHAIFALDINFIADPSNLTILNNVIIPERTHLIPCISNDISNYVATTNNFQNLLTGLTKSNYYKLCSLINRSSMFLGS